MPSIKLFTMVKDEVDIVEDWLLYHGYIFGFPNLHIIDNYSSDGTYEILQKYEREKNIFLIREKNYRKKGLFMRHLIKDRIGRNYDIAYPLDIDEFIVLYDKSKNSINLTDIRIYLQSLPTHYKNYKTNYIYSTISSHESFGYEKACQECKYGFYSDYGNQAKTFFNNRIWNGNIDHGNHCSDEEYYMTDLCLLHFHCRNINQIKKKTINNVLGLGYDINNLSKYINHPGNHHVKNLMLMQNNEYKLNSNYQKNDSTIDLEEFNNFIKNLHNILN